MKRNLGKGLDLLSIDDDLDLNMDLDSDVGKNDTYYRYPFVLHTSYDILCDPETFQVMLRVDISQCLAGQQEITNYK